MRELLIRYLLGELDGDEQRELQARLDSSPELRRELAQLRSCFAANRHDASAEPPGRLAERTAQRVTSCDGDDSLDVMPRESQAFAAAGDPPAGVLGWSLADLTVAGGVMLAVSMLVFPALRDSRDGTRRTGCQNNERQLGVYVTKFTGDHRGYLPSVGPLENAGAFIAQLIKEGCAEPEELALFLICPGAPQAPQIRAALSVPSADALRAMSPSRWAHFTAKLTPSYACRIGYWEGHKYHDVRNDGRTLSPVVGDSLTDSQDASISPNHGGNVVQILCWDGSVKSFTTSNLPGFGEDVYRNNLGLIAAGIGREDAVLAPTNAMPGLEFVVQAK